MGNNVKQELYESFVRTGFEPLKDFVERRRLEDDLTEQDINMMMKDVETNLNNWIQWLRHQKEHSFRGGTN